MKKEKIVTIRCKTKKAKLKHYNFSLSQLIEICCHVVYPLDFYTQEQHRYFTWSTFQQHNFKIFLHILCMRICFYMHALQQKVYVMSRT